MQEKADRLRTRGLLFALVGLSGVAVNTAVVYVLHGHLRWPLPLAVASATAVAILNNYLWNDRWTFGQRSPSLRRFARFTLSSLGSLALTTGATTALAAAGLPYLLALWAGVGASAAGNFAASMLWVWRPAQ